MRNSVDHRWFVGVFELYNLQHRDFRTILAENKYRDFAVLGKLRLHISVSEVIVAV
jgi:hypothetical protein